MVDRIYSHQSGDGTVNSHVSVPDLNQKINRIRYRLIDMAPGPARADLERLKAAYEDMLAKRMGT